MMSINGPRDINWCAEVTERVLAACYKALNGHHVLLEGYLPKPNMVTPGLDAAKVAPEVVAEFHRQHLAKDCAGSSASHCVPLWWAERGRGYSEPECHDWLKGKKPWSLSFSFGRALQQSTLKTLPGKEENVEKARAAFFSR